MVELSSLWEADKMKLSQIDRDFQERIDQIVYSKLSELIIKQEVEVSQDFLSWFKLALALRLSLLQKYKVPK